jgi:AcrR family transcriptional regulator
MQERGERRSNRERTEEMRRRLLVSARALFVERGYADTGTPEIVNAAGVTRGALYHHFADKRALFRAVVEAEAAVVAAAIEAAAIEGCASATASTENARDGHGPGDDDHGDNDRRGGRTSAGAGDALSRLLAGAGAYLEAMTAPGRTRLLLVEAPAVLGDGAIRAIEGAHAERTLREGLEEAMEAGAILPLPLEPLTALLSAMFDRAALHVTAGGRPAETLRVIETLLAGLAPPSPARETGG